MANARMIYCNRATTRDCAKKKGEKREEKHDRARGGRRHESINCPRTPKLFPRMRSRVLTVVQFRCRDYAEGRSNGRVGIDVKKSGQK